MGIGSAIIGAAGGVADAIFGKKQADENWDRQKKVLKNQIQWKVEDATKAGLHPLAALGVVPASVGGAMVGSDFQSMGQEIGRAAEALAAPEDKASSRLLQLEVERGNLQNELLKTQIASSRMMNMQQATPGVPSVKGGAVLGLPGGGRMPVEVANVAQDAENHFGEIGGELFGLPNLYRSAMRYMGYERLLTDDPIGAAATMAREWTKRQYQSGTVRGPTPGDFN